MSSQSSEGLPAYILLEHVKQVDNGEENHRRTTIIGHDKNSLFGEWLDGQQVINLLNKSSEEFSNDGNVGTPKVASVFKLASQSHSSLTTFWDIKAKKLVSPHEMPLEILNSTKQCHIRIRWLDENGKFYPWLYQWNIPPSSTYEQYAKPGHLFLISMIDRSADEEIILAAYRTKRALPSLSPHCIYIYDDHDHNGGGLYLEMLLSADETKIDALSVAVSDLDHHHETMKDRVRIQKVVTLLQTIISNLIKNPNEEKFQQLRMGNSKIKSITNEWGAMEILNLIGFTRQRRRKSNDDDDDEEEDDDDDAMEEEYLILSQGRMLVAVCQNALDILEILAHRLEPNFIPDLAPPTPWQEVSVSNTAGGGGGGGLLSNWNNDGTRGFLTEEERWARAERVVGLRSSGAARRPNPGEAPSSRGKWGR